MQRKEKQLEVWEELCKVFTERKIRYLMNILIQCGLAEYMGNEEYIYIV